MPVRFLEYNTHLIKQYLKGKSSETHLPFILNLCLFHYKINEPYPYPTHLYDCCPNPYLAKELGMVTKFYLTNLSTTLDSSLESYGTVGLNGKLFKYSREKELFEVLGEELKRCRKWILGEEMSTPPLGADYWESILCYASNVLNPAYHSEEDLVNLFKEKLFISKEEIMRTIAHQIEKRGEKRGMETKAIAIAKNMLKRGYNTKSIQEITELPKGTIENLKKGD
ncbi:MAG: hypothetical protein BGO68_05930 [Candidatus Amoebophilus sp. 36-38]|nr:MAG: hypothetical protein BGO68_05930 [Candidatus Amoebophilus sp. 36-38]